MQTCLTSAWHVQARAVQLTPVRRMQARVKGRLGQSQVAHYNLDRLGVQTALHLPSTESNPGSSGNISRYQTLQDTMPDMPDDVKQRLTSLLAAEFSKKVSSSHCFEGKQNLSKHSLN